MKREAVVDRTDEGDHRGGKQNAVPMHRVSDQHAVVVNGTRQARQPQQSRDEHRGEDRETAEQRR